MSALPIAPWEEQRDERTSGVLLLDSFGDDGKATAMRIGSGWRIVDWERTDDGKYWYAASFFYVPDDYLAALNKAMQP